MKGMLAMLLVITLIPVAVRAEKGTAATASPAHDNVDMCGLGWQVTDKHSFLATTTRGTTNIFVPPTFGMTSGTIGCDQHSFAKNEEAAVTFALANQDALSVELAQGRGEYVEGLAQTMGCTDTAGFAKMAQENYGAIVGKDGIETYKNIKRQIGQDPVLASSCRV